MANNRSSVVKELAEATSAQSQVANRYWIALITVALVSLLAEPSNKPVTLPLDFGEIPPSRFYFAAFWLLAVLTTAFSSAHAQVVRVQRMAHNSMDDLGDDPLFDSSVHPRDYFDAIRLPTVNRLAPLAQLFRGRESRFGNPDNVPSWRQRCSGLYYIALKTTSWFFYFIMPGVALWTSYYRTGMSGWVQFVSATVAGISTLALAHVFIVDVIGLKEVSSVIMESKPSPSKHSRAGKPSNTR